MTNFLLMRHGQPDYTQPGKWKAPGWGADLAPLTSIGEGQVSGVRSKIEVFGPEMVLCSPTTRTMHTALILREFLRVPFKVEFDLHEWVPDKSFQWTTIEQVLKHTDDFTRHDGEHPLGREVQWESRSQMRARANNVLRRYANFDRVLVICHAMLIESLTGIQNVNLVDLVPFEEG
jgi:broad specificity phosphatase PhoE